MSSSYNAVPRYSGTFSPPTSPPANANRDSFGAQQQHPGLQRSLSGGAPNVPSPLNPSSSSRDRDDASSGSGSHSDNQAGSGSGSGSANHRDSVSYPGGYPVPLPAGRRASSYASIGGEPGTPNSGNYAPAAAGVIGRHQNRDSTASISSLDEASRAIQTGLAGGDYSRYSSVPRPVSMAVGGSPSGLDTPGAYTGTDPSTENLNQLGYASSGYGNNSSPALAGFGFHQGGYRGSVASSLYSEGGRGYHSRFSTFAGPPQPLPKTDDSALLWDAKNAEADDFLHNPDPDGEKPRELQLGSRRGWINFAILSLVIGAFLAVFLALPIIIRYHKDPFKTQHLLGSLGRSYSQLIDTDTPESARKWTSFETGEQWDLVFSDEFNKDGRTFAPGDDPFWEANSLNYYGTHNFEWCDPEAVTTRGGKMVITLSEKRTENYLGTFDFQSGMVQSWNKLCFRDAYIEVGASQPGNSTSIGYWPGIWTQGNLARAGFGSTNDGLWPYSYNTCDVGTLRNQTWPAGTANAGTPTAARTSGSRDYGGSLSYLPGQRLSACTCPGEDHPGPSHDVGRAGPEIDLLEGMYYGRDNRGMASQSLQLAPFDEAYAFLNMTPHTVIHDNDNVIPNGFKGSINQEAASYIRYLDTTSYNDNGYTSFGYEYKGGDDGYITWAVNSSASWTIRGSAIGPNAATGIGQRPIPVEPMYSILNLFLSDKFQGEIDEYALTYPAYFFIDYVRIYQKDRNLDCSPKDLPTSDYISRHIKAYTEPEWTNWQAAGFTWPKNSLREGC